MEASRSTEPLARGLTLRATVSTSPRRRAFGPTVLAWVCHVDVTWDRHNGLRSEAFAFSDRLPAPGWTRTTDPDSGAVQRLLEVAEALTAAGLNPDVRGKKSATQEWATVVFIDVRGYALTAGGEDVTSAAVVHAGHTDGLTGADAETAVELLGVAGDLTATGEGLTGSVSLSRG